MPGSNIINPSDVEIFFEDGVVHVTWKPGDVPDGYEVEVIVKDGQGAALTPLPTITYANNTATVSGSAIVAGATLDVSLRLVAPPSTPTPVTLIALAKPASPTLKFTLAGLNVDWTKVDKATQYNVVVQNSTDTTVAPYTYTSKDNSYHALVPFNELSERATYQARVRAVADNSRSVWSDDATILIDKSLPVDPVLRALYDRLHTAGTNFDLNAAMVKAGNITTPFVTLLNQTGQTIALRDAQLSATISSVTVVGHLDIYNKTGVQGTFVFTVPSAMLQLDLEIALGSMSIAQLKSAELAPADIYSVGAATSWVDSLATIDNAVLQFNSATNSLVLTSSDAGPTWSVLGLANISLGSLKPQLLVTRVTSTSDKYYVPRLVTKLHLDSTHELDAYLQLPTGYLPWQLGLAKPFYLGSLADIYALFGGNRLSVPTEFESLGQITLEQLTLQHPPGSGIWKWYLAATLTPVPDVNNSTVPSWKIIPTVLELEQLGFGLKVNVYQSANDYFTETAGIISGRFKLGTLDPIDAQLQVPDANGAWTLTAATSVSQPFSLAETAQLVNNNSTALSSSLTKVGTVSGFSLEELRLSVTLEPTAQITAFSIAFQIQNWSIAALPWFKMDQIRARLNVLNPRDDGTRVITGELMSLMTLGSVQVGVMTSFDQQGIWRLALGVQSAQITALTDISNFASPGTVTAALPSAMPTDAGFEMVAFGMAYDSVNGYITEAKFGLRSQLNWQIIPNLFALEAIVIDLQITQANATAAKVVTGVIAGSLAVGSARFTVQGSRQDASSPWLLSGRLDHQVTFDFNELLQRLLSSEWRLPTGYGFPTSLTIVGAEATLVPATGKFDFVGDAITEWSFGFGSSQFAVQALGGEIHRSGTDETTPSSGKLYGIFTIGENIWGEATLALGAGTVDTVITVTASNTTQLSPAVLAAAISGDSTIVSATPQPSDFPSPLQFQAGIEVNLTKEIFLAWGELVVGANDTSPMYGLVALLIQKLPVNPDTPANPTWGYVLVAQLKNWRFAQISQKLAVVDSIITVEAAGIALASYDVDANTQQLMMGKLQLGDGVGSTAKRGLNFYATLQFGSGLLAQVAQLLGITTQGPFKVKGYIAPDATQSEFEASLGQLTLLGFLSFKNIVLKYLVQQANTFTLTGDIVVTIDQPYTFHGDLQVVRTTTNNITTTQANAHIATTQAIHNPLGIPALSLNALFFDFNYDFDGTQSDTQYALGGDVSFSDVFSLRGFIYFKNNAPAVVLIQLDNLDIGLFFGKIFNTTWPSDTLPIRLKNGMLYYAPNPVSLMLEDRAQKKTTKVDFLAGFRAATDVDILFIKDFHIDVTVTNNGIIATGGYLTPIDWGFIQFYRGPFTDGNNQPVLADPTKGPVVSINSATSTFTLSGGFGLFGTPIASLLMSVKASTVNGHITLDQDVPVFGRPSFDFVWDDDGFRVTNWGLGKIKLPDFDFNNLNLDGACPAAGIVKIPIRSKVDITPSFSIKMITPSGQTTASPFLQITINGTLNLVAGSSAYASDPLITANIVNALLNVPFPATGAFTWDTLGNSFVDCITSAAASIFDNLVKDPKNLAKLLAVEGIVWGMDAVKDFLICEGVEAAAAELFVEGAAGATAVTIGVPILGVVGIIVGGVVGSIDSHGNHHNGGSGHTPTTPRPNPPAAPTLSYSQGQLTVSWASVTNASRYAAVVKRDGAAYKQTDAITALSVPIPVEDGHTYTVQIVAAGDGGTSDPGAATSLTVLGHVNITGVSYGSGKITAQWSNGVPNASQYVGQLVNAAHTAITPPASATITNLPNTLSLSIDVPEGIPAGPVFVSVQAITQTPGAAAGDIAYSNSSIFNLDHPTITGLSFSNGEVIITLQANVNQATRYTVQYLAGEHDTVVAEFPDIPVAAQPVIHVPATSIATGNYKVQVQAVGAAQTTIPSPFVPSSTTVLVPGLITLTGVSYANNVVSASWTGSNLAQSYHFELRDSTNTAVASGTVAQPNPQTPAPTTLQVPIPATVARGAQYMARVQLVVNGLVGPWSAELPVTLLDIPSGLTLSYTGTEVQATWQSVLMATGYVVEIRGRDPQLTRSATTPPAIPPAPPATTVNVDVQGVPVDIYTAVIKATANQLNSAWSEPITLVLLTTPQINTLQYANNVTTISWSAVTGATRYNVELYDGARLVATGETQQSGATPPATQTTFDMTNLTRGVTYTARVNAGITGGVSGWSPNQSLLVLDPPTGLRLEYVSPNVVAHWDQVSYADSYNFVLRDTDDGPLIPVRPDIQVLTYALDVSQVADGNYPGHVQTNMQGQTSAWSAPVTVQVVHLTPEKLATQLHASGVIAPLAAPQIMAAFSTQFATNAPGMVTLLQGYFPESSKSLTQLAWALAKTPYDSQVATQALSALSGSSLTAVLAAIKAAYPTPSVQQQITELQSSQTAAQKAAQLIHTAHSDLNALSMAVLLVMNFADTVPTPTAMAQALFQGGYDSASAMSTLPEIFPLHSMADFMAAIRAAYPATPQEMAQQFHAVQVMAADAAPRLKQAFATYNDDAAGFVQLLQSNFPESATSLTQLAWALGASGYTASAATTALKGVSANLANVIGAIKAAYPDPATQQKIQQLLSQQTSGTDAAAQLHAANPSINALQMAVLLAMNFRETVLTPTQMAQALKAAAFSKSDTGTALSQLFPLRAAADLTTVLDTVYNP